MESLKPIGELSDVAKTLIEKVSDAIGGAVHPWQIKRIAKAEAEASIIKAKAEIEVSELQQRAFNRMLSEQVIEQKNMEEITAKAVPLLLTDGTPENLEPDWIKNFFAKSRHVSDEEMQILWANILAGEANRPGTYSKRTVNLVAALDKPDAELFQTLMCYSWQIGGAQPLVFDLSANIYAERGINLVQLEHLDDIGLINLESIGGYTHQKLPQKIIVTYFETPVTLAWENEAKNELDVGKCLLTKAGKQLAPICNATPIDGFLEHALQHWQTKGILSSTQISFTKTAPT